MSYEPDLSGRSAAAAKTNLPGIFLLIVGILNALAALGLLFSGVQGVLAKDKFKEDVRKGLDQGLAEESKKRPLTADEKKQVEDTRVMIERFGDVGPGAMLGVGVIALLASVVTILGGVRMRSLKSRGLAMFGAILAMIPCISPLGCCLVGEAIGIWALIALSSPEVKAASR